MGSPLLEWVLGRCFEGGKVNFWLFVVYQQGIESTELCQHFLGVLMLFLRVKVLYRDLLYYSYLLHVLSMAKI